MGMIPGMSRKIKDLDIDNDSFKHIEAMIKSMTLEERKNPDLMNQSRKIRIALGSGQEINDVNKMIKQFFQMSKMMKIWLYWMAKKFQRKSKMTLKLL